MRKLERFLFPYSAVVATVLFISLGVFSPTLINFISASLMLPIVFYFWIRITSPEAVSAEIWSIRFVTVLTIVCALGIYSFFLAKLTTNNSNVPTPAAVPTLTHSLTPRPTPTVIPTDRENISDLIFESSTPTPTPTP